MFSRVVLPDPDRPDSATSRPRGDSERHPAQRADRAARGRRSRTTSVTCAMAGVGPAPIALRAACTASACVMSAVLSGCPVTVPSARCPYRAVRPDADVVRLRVQPDPARNAERLGNLARKLKPTRPVHHRVLDGRWVMLPCSSAPAAAGFPCSFGRRVSKPRSADLTGHRGVMGDHQDRDAQLDVGGLQRGEHIRCGRGVQLTRGLVGEQQAGAGWQRDWRWPPAAAPAGHLAGVRSAQWATLMASSRSAARSAGSGGRRGPENRRQGHVLPCGQVGSRFRAVSCQMKPTVPAGRRAVPGRSSRPGRRPRPGPSLRTACRGRPGCSPGWTCRCPRRPRSR